MAPFRIGLYGCGRRTSQILEKAVKAGRAKVTLCYDIDPQRAEETAQKYGGKVCTKDELLSSNECDMLLIVLFPIAHPDALLECIDCGKPIYIEKPVATNLADVKRLVPLIGKGYVHVGCSYHYVPVFRTVENVVREGRIGNIISMHHVCMGHLDLHSDIYGGANPNWRGNPATGGELTQHGTHKFEFMRRLAGNFRTVTAMSLKRPDNPSNLEDMWELIMHQGECTQSSFRLIHRSNCHTELWFVEGEDATLTFEWNDPSTLKLYKNSLTRIAPIEIPLVENINMDDQLDDFIDLYKAGQPPSVDLEDGLWSILPPIYARESAATGKRIAFPERLQCLLQDN